MPKPDWKAIVRTVAPTIATALGGPLAGAAVQALSTSLLGKPDAAEPEVAAAVSSGSSDTLLKVKEAEYAFQQRMKELDIDVEKLVHEDRASARELAKADMLTPRALAMFITTGFFATLGGLMFFGFPDTGKEPLLIMLGSLGTAWVSVVAFYFGSTAGSARKTDVLERLVAR